MNEASAELTESSKVVRLGQRPLSRKSIARSDSDGGPLLFSELRTRAPVLRTVARQECRGINAAHAAR
ncbi:MAG TPA: hypothetical protein VH702_17145, partial [Vicinamibacterales bacterium]